VRTILLAIDGADGGAVAARHLAEEARRERLTIHLVKVQPPLRGYACQHLDGRAVREHYCAEGRSALAPARAILAETGADATAHVHVGEEAGTIAALARRLGADQIVMAEGDVGWLDRLMFRRFAARVIRRAPVPVLVVKERRRRARRGEFWRLALSR